MQHRNIVDLKDIIFSKPSKSESSGGKGNIYLVFEFVDSDLAGILCNPKSKEQLNLPHIKSIMHQILEGVRYMHDDLKMFHRDIKCANILISADSVVKLADFGLARDLKHGYKAHYTSKVVTLWYRAPELLFETNVYGPPVDMWSVGCVFAELILKTPGALFDKNVEQQQVEKIMELCGNPSEETWPGITKSR